MSIGRYIDFCMSFILLCGVSFELPMVLLFLSMAGIVNSRQLLSQWRWVIVAIVLGAGILTPSQDPLSMALVAVAMTGLYFFSLIPMRLLGK
jgi:sec-independent protein translocase protein TatC